MARKQVGIRLVAENGQRVRAEFDGVGDAGEKAFGRVQRSANNMGKVVRRALGGLAAGLSVAGLSIAVKSSLAAIDANAKFAASVGTTVESVQALHRAADLSGVSMGEAEAGVTRLTRRLSMFVKDGGGPAQKAIKQLHLNAAELLTLPIDQRLAKVNEAIGKYASESDRAALLSQLFGDRAWTAFSRISNGNLEQATKDVRDFGVAVSDADAAQIERTNDAVSRLGLISKGVFNQIAVAAAPALEAFANGMASISAKTGPLGQAISTVFGNLEHLAAAAVSFGTYMAGAWVLGIVRAAKGVSLFSKSLVVMRGALISTGIGALIVLAGELALWFTKLVKGAGGFGNAMGLLADVAGAAFGEIGTLGKALAAGLGWAAASIGKAFVDVFAWIGRKWAQFVNWMLTPFNYIMDKLEVDFRLKATSPIQGFADEASAWLGDKAGEMSAAASEALAGAVKTKAAVEALRDAMTPADDGLGGVPAASLPAAPEALGETAGAADDVTKALGKAGKAGGAAGKAIKDGADEAAEALKEQEKAAEEAAQAARERLEDAGKSLAEDTLGPMKEALKQGEFTWQGFASSVSRIAMNLSDRLIEAAFKPLENAIVNAFTGGGGSGLTGLLASFFGFAKGGAFSGGREVTAFATGGVIRRPVLFPFAKGIGLAGEAGEEAILPLRRGRGGRLGVEMTGGAAPAAEQVTKIVNVLDPSIVGDYLATPAGERKIVNVMRRNRNAVNA